MISPEHHPNLILLSLLVCTPTCVNCVSLKVCSFCIESKFNSEVAFKRWKSKEDTAKKKKKFKSDKVTMTEGVMFGVSIVKNESCLGQNYVRIFGLD